MVRMNRLEFLVSLYLQDVAHDRTVERVFKQNVRCSHGLKLFFFYLYFEIQALAWGQTVLITKKKKKTAF